MRRLLAATVFLGLLGGLGGLACSSSGSNGDAGGGGSGGSTPDATAAKTCPSIRICALDCADDACVTACKQGADSTAAALFDALDACARTMGGCTTPNDINCLCLAQCIQDPPCATDLGACLGNVTLDQLCDVRGCA